MNVCGTYLKKAIQVISATPGKGFHEELFKTLISKAIGSKKPFLRSKLVFKAKGISSLKNSYLKKISRAKRRGSEKCQKVSLTI